MSRSRRTAKADEYFRRAPNYSAEAIICLREQAKLWMALGMYPNSSELYLEAARMIEASHKFALPDNGFLFDHATAAMIDGFHPPFHTCVFEYGISGETGDDPPLPRPVHGRQRIPVSRVLVLCRCYKRNGDDVVSVMPVFASAYREWHLALFCAELSLNDFCAVDVPKVGGRDRFLRDGVGIKGCSFLLTGERSMEILGVEDTQDYRWLNERARKGIGRDLSTVLQACAALSCTNVTTELIRPNREARAARPESTLFDYHVLMIRPGAERHEGPALGGSHASPRTHLRRGHIRQHPTAGRIWVNSCVVNPTAIGTVNKDYEIVPRKK